MSHSEEQDAVLASDLDPVTRYIFKNYLNLLTEPERLAYTSILAEFKAQHSGPAIASQLRRLWISTDSEVQRLLIDGEKEFYHAVRDRVLLECPDKVYLNRCPKCGALARTPKACLCPACNHTWYELRQNT